MVGLVGELLERAARATPAAVDDSGSGWWFRHTDNRTWWAGSVLPHGAEDELAERIAAAERFYAEHDAVARFQICAGCPAGLDRTLADRGYRWESPISLLTAEAGATNEPPDTPGMAAHADTEPDPGWLTVLAATGEPGTDPEHETRLLARAQDPQVYVTVLDHDEPVGIGRAVADGGWTGVFNMATTRRARRRGVARHVLAGIARWAVTQDAPRLYLQVEESNAAALRLYETAGFTWLSTYHYRTQPTPTQR